MKIYGLNIDSLKAYKQKTKLLDYVYLHGVLEDKNKYDLIGVTAS